MDSLGCILIIEHDKAFADNLKDWLANNGLKAYWAPDADSGFGLARNLNPMLILGDLTLAIANGSQLLRALLNELPDTSVIVIDDCARLDHALKAIQEGASDFLVKSMLNEEILHLSVQRVMERQHLRIENEAYRRKLEDTNAKLEKSLQLLEYDQRAGRQVQSKLLPPSPHTTNGLTLNHVILPSLFLSGDFIDYFSLGPNRTAFYLADVSGHGASSAFVTVFLKTLTNRIRRHYEKRRGVTSLSTSKLLASMNEELRALDTGKHLTVFCGIIDVEHDTLTYSVGAHYPPAFLRQNGQTIALAERGLPLGLFADARYEEHVIHLAKEFSIVALSDGILEVMPKSDLVCKEGLLKQYVESVGDDFQQLQERLGLLNMGDLPDDIALLMIKRSQ